MEYQDTKKKLVDDYESRLSKLEDDSSSKIEYLEQKLKIANDELTMLGEFKQIKELVEKKLKVKEDELESPDPKGTVVCTRSFKPSARAR